MIVYTPPPVPPDHCTACGHVTDDLYRVDPATGRPTDRQAWCPPCYELAHLRAMRAFWEQRDRAIREITGGERREAA